MKCLICETEMPQRNGKFGTFYFCNLGHGTVSVQGSKVFATKAIFTKMEEVRKAKIERMEGAEMGMPDIEFTVRSAMASSVGFVMNDMDRFIEGGREAAQDEDDHWMNCRPY